MTMNMDGLSVGPFIFKFDATWAYVLCNVCMLILGVIPIFFPHLE